MVAYINSLYTLQESIRQRNAIIIYFTASWCGPCKRISPVFDNLASQYGNKVLFYKVDVDNAPDIAEFFNVSSMPTFVGFYRGSSDNERFSGASDTKLAMFVEQLAKY